MLNAEQLQWIKQRAWARYMFCMAIWLVVCLFIGSVPFFIIFSWQYAQVPGHLLVLVGGSLLLGLLMALGMGLMLILVWPLAKKSTQKLQEHIRQRLLDDLPAPELEPTPCPVGMLQIYKPLQYFPPTILSCFFSKENLNPPLCFVDGAPVIACYYGELTQIKLPVGSHEIHLARLTLPKKGGESKEVFCTNAVAIEIREDRPVVMVYKFKSERLLAFGCVTYLILWVFSWDPFGWFDWLKLVLPYSWNAPSLCWLLRLLLAEVCLLLPLAFYFKWAWKPVLEVITPEDAPPSR